MPQAKAKNPRKPVKFTSYTYNHGVKECFYWHDPSAKLAVASDQPAVTHRLVPKKGPVGKPLDRGFDLSGLENQPPRNPADDDHVIDALRGWPRNRPVEAGDPCVEQRTAIEIEAEERQAVKKTSKKSKAMRYHISL